MEAGNGVAYRLANIERRLERIEGLEPAVMRAQLEDVKDDIREAREELANIRKILTGFLLTFAFTGISIVIAVVSLTKGP